MYKTKSGAGRHQDAEVKEEKDKSGNEATSNKKKGLAQRVTVCLWSQE